MSFRLSDRDFRPEEHNLYFLFGLSHSASQSDIKAAYRRLMRKYHPDIHGGDERFQNACKAINSIYRILGDTLRRSEYDRIYHRKVLSLMAVWTYYDPDDFNENSYGLIPEGKYRVRIEQAEDRVSQSGKDMIRLTLEVSGYSSKVWRNIVLDSSNDEAIKRTNHWLGTIFSSFGITQGNMNLDDWKGKVGGAKIRHKKGADGVTRAEISYFLYRKEVDKLPDWQGGSAGGTINPDMQDFGDSDADRIPF